MQFQQPSILKALFYGFSSLFDFLPSFTLPQKGVKTDTENIQNDWKRVGLDIYKSMRLYEQETK